MSELLECWEKDAGNIKQAFLRLRKKLTSMEHISMAFKSRPGVSYSLRAHAQAESEDDMRLVTLIDVIDDDPESRWLSVCFYGEAITDEEELGNLIPDGLLGEDGHCFDIFEYDEPLLSYLENRIDEAYENTRNA
ncbi:MAG: hypothetical protein JW932_09215 [Deltaproteobacteria bacterium]|nr:hypothetical protein [Deltaproteobacteria bacterium]